MRLVDQRLYPAGEAYSGSAILEEDHIEFLKAYTSYEDAISHIYTGTEGAAEQQGHTLLKVDISYEEGLLYYMFDVNIRFVEPQNIGMSIGYNIDGNGNNIQQLLIPPPLWPIIYTIIIGLVAYILINSFNRSMNSVFYTPTGGGGETPKWSPFSYAVILIGTAFLLNALTGVSKEVRKY